MASDLPQAVVVAQEAFGLQDSELDRVRERQLRTVVRKTATGSANLDVLFSLDRRFRLIFVRCHFAGASGTAPFRLAVDSGAGSAYDTRLFTITSAGVDKDVHLRIGDGDTQEPAPWTFQPDDQLRIQWINPDSGNITWGLEVGLAMAY